MCFVRNLSFDAVKEEPQSYSSWIFSSIEWTFPLLNIIILATDSFTVVVEMQYNPNFNYDDYVLKGVLVSGDLLLTISILVFLELPKIKLMFLSFIGSGVFIWIYRSSKKSFLSGFISGFEKPYNVIWSTIDSKR